MKLQVIRGGLERLILLGLLVDSEFLNTMIPYINNNYSILSSKASATVCKWAIEYFEMYSEPARSNIQVVFDTNEKLLNEKLSDSIADLLETLDEEIQRRGTDFINKFIVDQATNFFKQKQLEYNVDEIQDLLIDNKVDEAQALIHEIASSPTVSTESVVSMDILTDEETLLTGFNLSIDPLLHFPSAFGQFVNPLMVRGGFVCFLGPEKRGKTWMLNEVAMQGFKAKLNIAYFNAGDMTNPEQAVRFATRIARHPSMGNTTFYTPVLDCVHNQDGSCTKDCRTNRVMEGIDDIDIDVPEDIELVNPKYIACRRCTNTNDFKGAIWYRKITVDNLLTAEKALDINSRFIKRHRLDASRFRMQQYPSKSLTIEMIDSILERWALVDGWTVDVLIIDYMDILDSNYRDGFRHGENEKWSKARGLCTKWNLLFVSATQADSDSYKLETITESNFSEDKRKYGHVTGMIALNKTPKEAELGIMRLGRFMTRNVEQTNKQVVLLQNLQRGMVHVGSFFRNFKKDD